MSPSAVSRSVQRLEEELGYPLLVRDNRSVQLTEQGQVFLEYALDVTQRYELLRHELSNSSEVLRGQLTLFASVTASMSILPNVLSEFRERYPEIHIQLETGYAVNALSKLAEGIDVVVAALTEEEDERYVKRILTSIPIDTVAPATGALTNYVTQTTQVDWSTVPMILPSTGQTRENINTWLKQEGITANVYAEVAGNEAILALVALGCGIGFVPRLVVNDSPLSEKVKVITGGPRLTEFQVGFCTRRKNLAVSPIIRAFWESIP